MISRQRRIKTSQIRPPPISTLTSLWWWGRRRRCPIALASIRRMDPNDQSASRSQFGPYTADAEVATLAAETVVRRRKTKAANLCKWVRRKATSGERVWSLGYADIQQRVDLSLVFIMVLTCPCEKLLINVGSEINAGPLQQHKIVRVPAIH